VRIGDDGTTQVLATSLAGYDSTGNMIFEAYSPDGLSVFGLITAKATKNKEEENPDANIVPVSKPAMSTNIGMVGWGVAVIQENPLILVIVMALIVLFVYFDWWRRRL
jgi:hypothetical protein